MRLEDIVWIGWDLAYIRDACQCHWTVKSEKGSYILGTLRSVKENLEENFLSQNSIEGIDNWIDVLERYEDGEPITPRDAEKLFTSISVYRDRITSELADMPILELDKCVTLNFELLREGAGGFFPEDIWNDLSEISKSDLNESAKCLVCGIPTAAAMTALRATEDVVRKYYNKKTRKNPSKVGWKAIINELLKEKQPGKLKYSVNKSLIGHLDFVRDNRNKVEHPEKVFSQRDAEGVYFQVVGTILDIYQDMGRKTRAKAIPRNP